MTSTENFVNPSAFHGSPLEDPETWWAYLKDWFVFRGWLNIPPPPPPPTDATDAALATHTTLQAEGERKMREIFPLIFRESANQWYRTLEETEKASLASMRNCFKERYMRQNDKSQTIADVWNNRQLKNESVDNYYVSLRKLAKIAGVDNEEHLKHALVNGFLPNIKREVILTNPDNILGVLNLARRVEQANLLLRKIEAQLERSTINDVTTNKPVKRSRRDNSPSPQRGSQKVNFEDRARTHESRDQRNRGSDNYVSEFNRKDSYSEQYRGGYRSNSNSRPPS